MFLKVSFPKAGRFIKEDYEFITLAIDLHHSFRRRMITVLYAIDTLGIQRSCEVSHPDLQRGGLGGGYPEVEKTLFGFEP